VTFRHYSDAHRPKSYRPTRIDQSAYGEGDRDGHDDRNRSSIQARRRVTPLADGVDGRLIEEWYGLEHGDVLHDAALIERVRRGLEQAGVLQRSDEVVMSDVKDLYYAYVLFDRYRGRAVQELLAELERRGISSIGRYGLWEHTSMEDAIAQGQQAAARLRMKAAA